MKRNVLISDKPGLKISASESKSDQGDTLHSAGEAIKRVDSTKSLEM